MAQMALKVSMASRACLAHQGFPVYMVPRDCQDSRVVMVAMGSQDRRATKAMMDHLGYLVNQEPQF